MLPLQVNLMKYWMRNQTLLLTTHFISILDGAISIDSSWEMLNLCSKTIHFCCLFHLQNSSKIQNLSLEWNQRVANSVSCWWYNFWNFVAPFFRTNLPRIVHTEKAKMLSIVEGYQFLFVFWMRTNQTKLRFSQHCWCYVYTFLQHIGST